MQIGGAAGSSYVPPTQQGSGGLTPAKSKADTAVADFMAYATMTPAEKMRASILDSLGLNENDLKGMDPKERAKVEEKIREMIKQKVEQSTEKQTGVAVDLKV